MSCFPLCSTSRLTILINRGRPYSNLMVRYVKKIELALYRTSPSLSAYEDIRTLEIRLKQLAVLIRTRIRQGRERREIGNNQSAQAEEEDHPPSTQRHVDPHAEEGGKDLDCPRQPFRWTTYDSVSCLPDGMRYGTSCVDCSICHSGYNNKKNMAEIDSCSSSGIVVALLPCGHVFHHACVNSWASIHATCPLCRHDLSSAPMTKGSDLC